LKIFLSIIAILVVLIIWLWKIVIFDIDMTIDMGEDDWD